jgi:voltage-gated potassium channel
MADIVDPRIPTPAQRRRVLMIGVGRGLGVATVLTVAYFYLPLEHLASLPFGAIIACGVVILGAVTSHQIRSIFRAAFPAIKAVEALTLIVPFFLLLFASTYFLASQADSGSFNLSGLSRGDTLYFTVTVFATVGFGDIVATSQTARTLVTVQMVLDLIVLGAVIRSFVEAVRMARSGPGAGQAPRPADS